MNNTVITFMILNLTYRFTNQLTQLKVIFVYEI